MSRRVASARAPNMRSKSGGAICIDTTIRLYEVGVKRWQGVAWLRVGFRARRSRFRPPDRAPRHWPGSRAGLTLMPVAVALHRSDRHRRLRDEDPQAPDGERR